MLLHLRIIIRRKVSSYLYNSDFPRVFLFYKENLWMQQIRSHALFVSRKVAKERWKSENAICRLLRDRLLKGTAPWPIQVLMTAFNVLIYGVFWYF